MPITPVPPEAFLEFTNLMKAAGISFCCVATFPNDVTHMVWHGDDQSAAFQIASLSASFQASLLKRMAPRVEGAAE